MKKKVIISYLLAISLLLSACIYRLPDDTQSSSAPALQDTHGTTAPTKDSNLTPSYSDTSIPLESIEYSTPTGNITNPEYGGTITVGPYTFQYSSISLADDSISGWTLISCENYVEVAVIPSDIMGIPVVGIGYWHGYDPPFAEGNVLTSIIIPDTVISICWKAFRYCHSLTEIQLSSGIKDLGYPGPHSDEINYLFADSAVKFLEVPEGTIKLWEYVFAESTLESIILPSTLETIEYRIFENAPLKEVFFRGTEEQCLQSLKDQVAEREATLYYLSEEEPTEEGNFWHYVDGKPVIW